MINHSSHCSSRLVYCMIFYIKISITYSRRCPASDQLTLIFRYQVGECKRIGHLASEDGRYMIEKLPKYGIQHETINHILHVEHDAVLNVFNKSTRAHKKLNTIPLGFSLVFICSRIKLKLLTLQQSVPFPNLFSLWSSQVTIYKNECQILKSSLMKQTKHQELNS